MPIDTRQTRTHAEQSESESHPSSLQIFTYLGGHDRGSALGLEGAELHYLFPNQPQQQAKGGSDQNLYPAAKLAGKHNWKEGLPALWS